MNTQVEVKMGSAKVRNKLQLVLVFTLVTILHHVQSYMVGNNPHHLRETLDPEGRFQLEWQVDFKNKHVIFHLTVQTTGYVGFGLNRVGTMTGADLVIGGVNSRGRIYFGDYHGVGEQRPVPDASQDWKLISGNENGTHTMLSFYRAFDTCDLQDYPITDDQIVLLWAIGATDEIIYHQGNRGVFNTYLLTPDHTPQIITEPGTGIQRVLDTNGNIDTSVNVWTVNSEMAVPPQETLYWCTMHRTPRLARRNHVIGFNVRLHNEASRRHLHHLGVTRCRVPRGSSATAASMFDQYVGSAGDNCLTLGDPTQTSTIPIQYCLEFDGLWGIGGRGHFHPPQVGFPFDGEEYYVLQVHLDNPGLLTTSRLNISVDYFYTENIRPNEGGVISQRHEIPGLPPSFLIPPNSPSHQIRTICGTQCTREMLPPQGITIYAFNLHTHDTGRIIRVRHFRGDRELPYLALDENFYPSYQPVRTLREVRRFLPGDQLVTECVHDTTQANGTVVGGYSTSQEMCVATFLNYQKLTDIIYCDSQITTVADRRNFLAGVENITWSVDRLDFIVDPGHPLAGMTIAEVSNNNVTWTLERREELQRYHLYRPHMNRCPREFWTLGPDAVPQPSPGNLVTYPYNIKPYQRPPRQCSKAEPRRDSKKG